MACVPLWEPWAVSRHLGWGTEQSKPIANRSEFTPQGSQPHWKNP